MTQPMTGLRPALSGFLSGVAYSLLSFTAIRALMVGENVVQEWRVLLVLSALTGIVFAIGRGIAGAVAGALLGAIAGVFLGGALSVTLPQWTISYVVLEPVKSTAEFHLSGPDLDGETIDVRDYRGKVLLVDFWATWCLPCVQELPHVLDAYEKYHADGFEVLAVSLDNEREDLEAFLKTQPLPWKQILYTEPGKTGWKNPLVKLHGIEGIPATFLLDRQGRVVAKNLRGDSLSKAVSEELKVLDDDNTPAGMQKRIGVLSITLYVSMLVTGLALAVLGAVMQRLVVVPVTSSP